MGIISKILGVDKAVDGVTKIASQALTMWDGKEFTAQERVAAFESIAKITSSKETSISRRVIIWALMGIITFAFIVGMIWISLGSQYMVDDMIELIQALKIDWAFSGGVAFYFLTHLTRGGK